MTVRVYRSSDASAPILSGAQGSLIALLDACLVNGYGSKTASGWTKPFTTTNKAAFRTGGGNQRYLVVDETVNNGSATFFGFETMTAITTGVNQFPTVGQGNILYFFKSSVTAATSRNWIVIATDRFVHVISDYNTALNDFSSTTHQYLGFGDIKSFASTDPYGTIIVGNSTNTFNDVTIHTTSSSSNVTLGGHFLARSYSQIGTAAAATKVADYSKSLASSGMPFPNPVDNKIWFSPFWVCESTTITGAIRGVYPGLWATLHSGSNFSTGDVISGISNIPGVTLEAVSGWASTTSNTIFLETSDTW